MKKAFTLVELAIVIVIIGLLVSGVLVGQQLISQARIKSQITQLRDYETAVIGFKSKYNCLPGDCANASRYFSGIINGNGNGDLENNGNSFYDAGNVEWFNSPEYYNFFAELALGKFIKGSFDNSTVIGQGIPTTPMRTNTGFFAASSTSFETNGTGRNPMMTSYKTGKNAFYYVVCNINRNPNLVQQWDDHCGIYTGQELGQIDTKLDDGKPLSGNLFGFGGNYMYNDCVNGTDYQISNEDPQCQAIYVFDK